MNRISCLALLVAVSGCSASPTQGVGADADPPDAGKVGPLADVGVPESPTPVVDAGISTDAGISADAAADQAVAPEVLPPPTVPDYLIVASDTLSSSAARYKTYRESRGHMVDLKLASELANGKTDRIGINENIRDFVNSANNRKDPKRPLYLLILGDDEASQVDPSRFVPAYTYAEPFDGSQVTTDNYYADMNSDGIPDVAVGRIAATKNEEVDLVLGKVKAVESTYHLGEQNRRINLFASEGGFGTSLDQVIENLAFQIVEDVSYDYDISMTYAKQTSPYVFIPEQFSDKVYERMNEGALMVSYIGHGYRGGFADLVWNKKKFPIVDTAKLEKFAVSQRSPILTFIACSTGEFDKGASVSERIVRQAGAPSVVLSSTEESHPAANAIFIREIGRELTDNKPSTVGQLFIRAKERFIRNDDELRTRLLPWLQAFLKPGEWDALQRTHLYMYTLFGDPALSIQYAKGGSVTAPAHATAGEVISISASMLGVDSGDAKVTLESVRSEVLGALSKLPSDSDSSRNGVITNNYATANNKTVTSTNVQFTGGKVQSTLTIPVNLPNGNYHIKVYAKDAKQDAIASTKIVVSPNN